MRKKQRERLRKLLTEPSVFDAAAKRKRAKLRSVGRMNRVRDALDALTDAERVEVLSRYCHYCGGPSGCQCGNET